MSFILFQYEDWIQPMQEHTEWEGLYDQLLANLLGYVDDSWYNEPVCDLI